MIEKASLATAARNRLRQMEDWWFDRTRGVQTAPDPVRRGRSETAGPSEDGHIYLPARAANARDALTGLPLRDPREYTFLDIGSGKGRILFVAAEQPFAAAVGVEYSADLHRRAEENIQHFRRRRNGCSQLKSVYANAAEYDFPPGKLVIYLFNPFGRAVMSRMLDNLEHSIKNAPRHVIVVLLWPELSDMVEAMSSMRVYRKTRRHHIYETENYDPPRAPNASSAT